MWQIPDCVHNNNNNNNNKYPFCVEGELVTAFTRASLTSVSGGLVVALILNNALLGIVTSLFLKKAKP
jgi:hypothetical protein